MVTRTQRLHSYQVDKVPEGARVGHPSAFALDMRSWSPPRPADPLAPSNNAAEIRCRQCGMRMESSAYTLCPRCGSDNFLGV